MEKASASGLHFENQATIDEGLPEVLIENIPSLQSGQQIVVKGTLTMDLDEVRTIQINGTTKRILDAAYISDNTGIKLLLIFLYDKFRNRCIAAMAYFLYKRQLVVENLQIFTNRHFVYNIQ